MKGRCPKCNKPYYSENDSLDVCKCIEEPYQSHPLIGWICPLCGRGLNPFTQNCNCKGFKVTCTHRIEKEPDGEQLTFDF